MVLSIFLMSIIISNTVCTNSGANPRDGSSRSIISGSLIRPLPIASICCSPPLKVPAICFSLSFNLGKSSYTFSRSSFILFLSFLKYAPSIILSSTVRFAKTSLPSGTWHIPSFTTLLGFTGSFSPLYSITPCLYFKKPDIALSSVDLPAPFEPIIVTISPLFISKLTPFSA
ncbi:hypothetical protein SDC9_154461 [bioreactor metagenome]|uniref:Uncharacterized protein n=1 Tax=bioreactor metagenome TaxID=1076179 RepID=A0A645EYR3_9ZZZZ